MNDQSAPESSLPQPDLAAYVDQMATMLDLSLTPESRAGVIDNLERIQAIAHLVNTFPLPSDVEAAPQFEP
jgi:hypothetical protein